MTNPEILKVISIEETPAGPKESTRTVLLSQPDNEQPTHQLPISEKLHLTPGMIVEVTKHSTEPSPKGGTIISFEINPQK